MSICSVVSSNDVDPVYRCNRVTQKRNSSVFIELFAVLFASNIFVISKTCINRSLDISKLLCHILFPKWAQVAVNNITTNQHKVWLFVVNQLHPAFKLLFSVVISQVNIANHHNLLRLGKLLLCGQSDRHSHLFLVVDVAINKQCGDENKDTCRTNDAISQKSFGQNVS